MQASSKEDRGRIEKHELKEVELTGEIASTRARVKDLLRQLAEQTAARIAAESRATDNELRVDEAGARVADANSQVATLQGAQKAADERHRGICKALRDEAAHAAALAKARVAELEQDVERKERAVREAVEAMDRHKQRCETLSRSGRSHEKLLRTTNEKLVKKLQEVRSATRKARVEASTHMAQYEALVKRCEDPQAVRALVRRICVPNIAPKDLSHYCGFSGALLNALLESEKSRIEKSAACAAPSENGRRRAHSSGEGESWWASWFDGE